jgi:signal transduction histidine kinase
MILGADITENLQLEEQLAQARKLEAVGQLAAGVAHEINTPMQYVGDNLDFLRSKMDKLKPVLDDLPAILEIAEAAGRETELVSQFQASLKKLKAGAFVQQVGEAIHDSQEGVQHVSRIVKAMKEFAHPGQDEKAPVDINRALDSTIAVSTNEWKYVAEIERDYDPSIPLVDALGGELNQVFLNLLVNAAHAVGDANDHGAKGKGVITLATRAVGGFVQVSITDSGTGIPQEIQQRIFDPFFTTKEVGKGTGQGLAIAHSVVVKEHGGKLRFSSSPGEGTTFFVELPIQAVEGSPDDLTPAEAST